MCKICLETIEKGSIHSHSQENCICVTWRGSMHQQRGCIDAMKYIDNVWLINRVLVQPKEARRKGVGRQMMNSLKEEAKKLGVKQIIVYPSGYDMPYSEQICFYKSQGFKEENLGMYVLLL